MTLRRTALGGILAVLVSAMAVGPALAARLWTLTATPLTFPAGAATAVTLTVTNVGGSGGGDEITCVTVDVPSTFTVSGVSIVSIKRQTSGHGWIAMTTAISGGTRITIKEPTDRNPLVGLPLADQAIFRVSGTASALGTLIWSGAAADKPGPAGSAACGSGTFPGLTVSLIVTALLPTPAPTPTPTPTPSPTPTPTPSPTPTPTPTPKPTPAPTPTPTPTPRPTVPPSAVPTLPIPTASLPIPIPSLPIPTASLSVPSIPPLVSLPPLSSLAPSPTSGFPEASPSTDPAGSPTGSANPTPSASTGADGGAAGPTGGGSGGPGGPGVPPGVGGEAGPAVIPVIPVIHDAFTIPGTSSGQGAFDNFDLARTSLASLDAFVWALPAFGLTVPGMLLVVVVLAQAGAGAAWLPVARRKLGVFGFGRSRRGARRAA